MKKPLEPRPPDRPDVSIVVATYNEARHIERCIGSIYAAEPFADRFEVLVVDGGSTDGTRDLVAALAARHPEVCLLDNPRRVAPVAFNVGIRAARGDWVFILGAHSEYDPSYFRLCLLDARRTGAANTGGRALVRTRGTGLQARLASALFYSRFGMGASPYRRREVPEGPATTAAFGCFPRWAFERFGLYDERLVLNQDWELNQRIVRGGGLIWLDPRIRVYWYAREDVRDIVRRSWDIGLWVAYMWALGGHTVAARHAVPAVFAAALAVPGVGIAALAAHQAVALAAAAAEAVRARDPRLVAALPPLFLAFHGAYGAGTIWGLARAAAGRLPFPRRAEIEKLEPRGASSPDARKPKRR